MKFPGGVDEHACEGSLRTGAIWTVNPENVDLTKTFFSECSLDEKIRKLCKAHERYNSWRNLGPRPWTWPHPDYIAPWIFPYFLRPQSSNGLDGYAFHYSIYRSLIRFLRADDKLVVTSDLNTNFITAWNQMLVTNDFLNPDTGLADPNHLFGTSNFDVFRWPSLANGTLRSAGTHSQCALPFPRHPPYVLPQAT
ncbi:hypothetical protein EV424DRAFT_1559616 [Suillus variegatus]|nr:hypothetical protein EV424DRAFT_1559616 [Suillus variegatus]